MASYYVSFMEMKPHFSNGSRLWLATREMYEIRKGKRQNQGSSMTLSRSAWGARTVAAHTHRGWSAGSLCRCGEQPVLQGLQLLSDLFLQTLAPGPAMHALPGPCAESPDPQGWGW